MDSLLSGIRVVTPEAALAAPFASMIMGDLGAEVIKIEPPEGDATRGLEKDIMLTHRPPPASTQRRFCPGCWATPKRR